MIVDFTYNQEEDIWYFLESPHPIRFLTFFTMRDDWRLQWGLKYSSGLYLKKSMVLHSGEIG